MRKTYYVIQRSSDKKFWDGIGWAGDLELAALYPLSEVALRIMEGHLRLDGNGYSVQRVSFTVYLFPFLDNRAAHRSKVRQWQSTLCR